MLTDGSPAPGGGEAPRAVGRVPRLSRSEWVLLLVLAAVQFTHIVDFVITVPLQPQIQDDLQISPEEAPSKLSWIVSAYGFSASATGLLAAKLLNRFDRKKAMLVLLTGFTVGTFACTMAPNYGLLLVGRAVAGAFGGIMGACVLTIVSDVFPESRRATAMAVVMSSWSVGSIVGIFVGLEIANWWGWRAPFAALAILCLPALALAWRVLPPLRRHLEHRDAPRVSLHEVLLHPTHLRAYALTLALIMGSWMIITPLPLFLVKNQGWAEADLRWVWLCGGVATLLAMTPTGWLADRRDKLAVFRVIGLLSIVPVLVLTNLPPTSALIMLLVTTLFMVSTNLRWVPVMAMFTISVPVQRRGPFMSVNTAVQQFVMAVAAMFSGRLLVERQLIGVDGSTRTELEGFPLAGILAASSMLLAVFLAGRLRRGPHTETLSAPASTEGQVHETALQPSPDARG